MYKIFKKGIVLVYLDNSATTSIYDEVVDEITDVYKNANYNPSAAYDVASIAEKKLSKAREIIASSINADKEGIYFTSGGSEGNNTAILGVARACQNRGKHIITDNIEHDSVNNVFKYLEQNEGYEVTYIEPDKYGVINPNDVRDKVRKDTTLVSIMHVNNETGALNDIKTITSLVKKQNSLTIVHSDSVQSYLKLPIDVEDLNVDIITTSAHKVHGPKGIGFIYIKKNTKIAPLIYGGGQESGFRSGTQNVALISGFSVAVDKIIKMGDYTKKISEVRDYLKESIIKKIADININTPIISAPHILSVSFAGVKSEILLHYLEMDKIYVSTGSACSSKKKTSRVLQNIKLDDKYIDGTIRFSLDENIDKAMIDFVVEKLQQSVSKIRAVTKYTLKK